MNRVVNIYLFLILIALGCSSFAMEDSPKLYVTNRSGWKANLYINGKEIRIDKKAERELSNDLNNINSLAIARRGQVWGIGAKKMPLDSQLAKIKQESNKNVGKDVVLFIEPSYTTWEISWNWIDTDKLLLEQFEIVFQLSDKEIFEKILELDLSDTHKKKAREICSTDYSIAKKKGYFNLCDKFVKEFKEEIETKVQVEGKLFLREGKKTPKHLGPVKVTISKFETQNSLRKIGKSEAEKIIDKYYRVLQNYIIKGYLK